MIGYKRFIFYLIFFQKMEGRVNLGKVDCDQHNWLCRQAGIQAYPTVRFYKGLKGKAKQQVIERERRGR